MSDTSLETYGHDFVRTYISASWVDARIWMFSHFFKVVTLLFASVLGKVGGF